MSSRKATGVDLLLGHDLANRVQRGHHPLAAVIIHAKVAMFFGRVDPTDAEDGKALVHQIANHRVMRAEVQDIIFHDPGGHDQDRLGLHLVGGRAVLQQLEQFIAEHDLARGAGDVATDFKLIGRFGRLAGDGFAHVLQEMAESGAQVLAPLTQGGFEHIGVQGRVVRWRQRIQHLMRHEVHPRDVGVTGAADRLSRGLPPVFGGQIPLFPEVQNRRVPGGVGKAAITLPGRESFAGHQPGCQLGGIHLGMFGQLQLAPRRA